MIVPSRQRGGGEQIKLLDFGIAKLVESQGAPVRTITTALMGTPTFMSPEQCRGAGGVGDKSDVYSLGVLMYLMLSGRPPYVGVSLFDTLQKVQHSEYVALRVINPALPRDLETICHKCLEKRISDRFANSQELVAELERFQRGLPIQSRSISPFERCRRWCRRRPSSGVRGPA